MIIPVLISSTPESASLLLLWYSTSRISSGSSFILVLSGGDSANESGEGLSTLVLIGTDWVNGINDGAHVNEEGGDGCLTGDVDMGETLSFSSCVWDDSELYDDVSSEDWCSYK